MCTVHESLKKNYFNQLVIKIIHTCLSLSLISSLNISLKLTLSLRPLTLSTPISQAIDQPQTYVAIRLRPVPPIRVLARGCACLSTHPFCRPNLPTWLECLLVVGFFFFFSCYGLLVVVVVVVVVVVAVAEEKDWRFGLFFSYCYGLVVVVVVVVMIMADGRGDCGWCCGCFFG